MGGLKRAMRALLNGRVDLPRDVLDQQGQAAVAVGNLLAGQRGGRKRL